MTKRKKRSSARICIITLLSIIVLLVLVGGFVLRSYWTNGLSAFDPEATATIEVTVPQGTGTKGIGGILEEHSVIRDSDFFAIASRIKGNDGKYRAGKYTLSASMTLDEIFNKLLVGQDETIRFTIPEGYDIRRTSAALQDKGLIDSESFLAELKSGSFDYRFLEGIPVDENQLEGFLYPETYDVYANATEREIIERMLSQFDAVFTEEHYARAEELGMSVREVINLASVIEREAVVSEDRPVISGVFHNRLAIAMPLQSCATVQYILGEQKPVLSIKDTQIDSPYNTYIVTGLPPTPICSPGIESINAALWPTESDYLYFLAKGDGSHVFSITYDEHLRNKAIYIDN